MARDSGSLKGQSILVQVAENGIAALTLSRPELHNAFDDELISGLTQALRVLERNASVRVVVLSAQGKSFSAGADLNWMKRMAGYSRRKNLRDALGLAELMRTLHGLNKPTIARVQGAAYGGGVGLVAACDIAIASREATFALSEVRLGLVPAVIGPYVVAAIGERMARRYFLTGERFDAAQALGMGLVHDVCEVQDLDDHVQAAAAQILLGGPAALAAAKRLVRDVARRPLDEELAKETAALIAGLRTSPEGKEGIGAFLEKRSPRWAGGPKVSQPGKTRPRKARS
jgi:methylglutaconyl-CoA hydratase